MKTYNNIKSRGRSGYGKDFNADVYEDHIRIYGHNEYMTGFYAGSTTVSFDFDRTFKIGDVVNDNSSKYTLVGFRGSFVVLEYSYNKERHSINLYNFIKYNSK